MVSNEETKLTMKPSVEFIDVKGETARHFDLSSYHSKSQSVLPLRNIESQGVQKRNEVLVVSLQDRRTALTSQAENRKRKQSSSIGSQNALLLTERKAKVPSFLETIVQTPLGEDALKRKEQTKSTIDATRKLVISELAKRSKALHSNTKSQTITFNEGLDSTELLSIDKPWLFEHFEGLQRARMVSMQDITRELKPDVPKSARENTMEQMIKGHFSKALMERYKGQSDAERIRLKQKQEKRQINRIKLKSYYLV